MGGNRWVEECGAGEFKLTTQYRAARHWFISFLVGIQQPFELGSIPAGDT